MRVKIVIAIDGFKESLTSLQAGEAARAGALAAIPDADIEVFPLADGGEGTAEAMTTVLEGQIVQAHVTGPLGEQITAQYGIIPHRKLAVLEMQQAAGLMLVSPEKRNPMNTTTYGVGEIIRHAMDLGYREFIVGLGGSATNDGGVGMLEALGIRFLDAQGQPVGPYGRDVAQIAQVDLSGMDPRLQECVFELACDVTNPLCGSIGASAVFGPQKGADPQMVAQLDSALAHFAAVTQNAVVTANAEASGAGAAGGLGFAFMSYLGATLRSGIQTVIEMVGLEDAIKDADYVVTGEGRLDAQTAMGKAPMGVAQLAKKYNKPVIALAGSVLENAAACNEVGIDSFFSVLKTPITLQEAMQEETARRNIELTSCQIFNLIRVLQEAKNPNPV